MAHHIYHSLSEEECDLTHAAKEHNPTNDWTSLRTRFTAISVGILLAASVALNCYFLWRTCLAPWELLNNVATRYAGLRRDLPWPYSEDTPHASTNRTIQDDAWDDPDLMPWAAFVALDDSYSASVGLAHSQRWPWDASKGVYIVAAGHEMHCLYLVRQFINDVREDILESERLWSYGHVMHCLNLLRQATMCNADDTPLYIGRLNGNVHAKDPLPGTGVPRMCRDWHKLMEWSRARSACFLPWYAGTAGLEEIERYKFCPDQSTPWLNPKIRS